MRSCPGGGDLRPLVNGLSGVRPRGGRGLHRDQLRRVGSLVLVVVAALASIATTPPPEDVSVREAGPRVELSAEQPEALLVVEIQPNAEAAPAPRKVVLVRATPVWSGQAAVEETEETEPLEGRVPAGGFTTTVAVPSAAEVLELEVLDADGGVLEIGTGESLRCEGEACAGLAAVRFRLLDPTLGTLVVNWELEARFHFGEGQVPRDADIAIAFGEMDPGVTAVAASGTVAADRNRDRYDLRAVRIQIHAPEGVPPDAELRFEPLDTRVTAVLHEAQSVHRLVERMSVPVTPPDACLQGACDWSLLVIGDLVDWQLVAPPEIGLEVGVAEVTPVELASEPVTGRPVRMGPDEQVRLVATVEVDPSVVAGPDFEGIGVLAAVEFTMTWDDPDANLIVSRDTGFTATRRDSTLVASNPLPLDCDALRCRGVTDIVVFFSQQGEGTVTWIAQAYIPFLFTGQIPEDAVLVLEVTR